MKKLLSIILTLCLLSSYIGFADGNAFEDVPESHWAYDEIQYFYNQNIVNGINEKYFAPDEYVTREQFAKILAITFNKTESAANTQTFSDVTPDMWSYDYIEAVKEYLTGYYPDGGEPFFNPTAKAAREDIAYALVKINNMHNGEYDEDVLSQFKDNLDVSPGLKPYVAVAVENGLIKGYTDGTLKPQVGITRAEAVTLLFRAIKQPVATPVPTPKFEVVTAKPKPTAESTASPKAEYTELEYTNVLQISGYKDDDITGKVYVRWSEEKQDATFYAALKCNNGGFADYVECEIELTETISCTENKIEGYFNVEKNGYVDDERIKGTIVIDGDTLKLNTNEPDYKLIASLNENAVIEEEIEYLLEVSHIFAKAKTLNGNEVLSGQIYYTYQDNNLTYDANVETLEGEYSVELIETSSISANVLTGTFRICHDKKVVEESIKGTVSGFAEGLEGNFAFTTDDGEWTLSSYIVEIGY